MTYHPNMPIALCVAAVLGFLGATAALAALTSSPPADARGELCAELGELFSKEIAIGAPGLRAARTSEDLEDLAQYLNLCYVHEDEKWNRLAALQRRQIILELRELNAALERLESAGALTTRP